MSDQPEGETSAWFTCECGHTFGLAIIIEPFGKAFLYGIEAFKRRRYSNACIQFATSFEVFQKHFVEALLKNAGVEAHLARFFTYDLDLDREKYSRLACHMLHSKLKHPDVSVRNSAVHSGRVPQTEKIVKLADDVLEKIDTWITAGEQRTGDGYQGLMDAWMKAQKLTQDFSEFERAIFDLRTAHILAKEQWEATKG